MSTNSGMNCDQKRSGCDKILKIGTVIDFGILNTSRVGATSEYQKLATFFAKMANSAKIQYLMNG